MIGEIRQARREAYELGEEILPFDDACIMFQDEARFGRINAPHRCWVKGERPVAYCQTVREYTYAFVAVCPFNGDMVSLILPWANTKTMNIHLAEISRRHCEKHVLLFVDKAAWHTAKGLNIPKNIRLVPILPYSLNSTPQNTSLTNCGRNIFTISSSTAWELLKAGLRLDCLTWKTTVSWCGQRLALIGLLLLFRLRIGIKS